MHCVILLSLYGYLKLRQSVINDNNKKTWFVNDFMVVSQETPYCGTPLLCWLCVFFFMLYLSMTVWICIYDDVVRVVGFWFWIDACVMPKVRIMHFILLNVMKCNMFYHISQVLRTSVLNSCWAAWSAASGVWRNVSSSLTGMPTSWWVIAIRYCCVREDLVPV